MPTANEKPTKVMFFFDTEDYTCDRSNDAIRDIANVLTKCGVKGNFNIAGFLGLRLLELGRTDVIEALRPHVIGTQTLYHSRHPGIAELSEDPDYWRAYRRVMADEARGVGMLESAFGEGRIVFACPPGNSVSSVGMDVYSDLGINFNAGTGFYGTDCRAMLMRPGDEVDGLWFANQMQLPYFADFSLENLIPEPGVPKPDFDVMLDKLSQYNFAGVFMHPHIAVKKRHWDGPNYRGGNRVKWREWLQVEDRDPTATEEFYRQLELFVKRIAGDFRFQITDIDECAAALKPRKAIGHPELKMAKTQLESSFTSIKEPVSWCVADIFQAAVKMIRGEADTHIPGKVHGFLETPFATDKAVEVTAKELVEAANGISLEDFVPAKIELGGKAIGPADFLFAMLDVLVDGKQSVRIEPGRNQLGEFSEVPSLETFSLAGPDKWIIHPDDFKDTWVSHRLRLQLWTLRIE